MYITCVLRSALHFFYTILLLTKKKKKTLIDATN